MVANLLSAGRSRKGFLRPEACNDGLTGVVTIRALEKSNCLVPIWRPAVERSELPAATWAPFLERFESQRRSHVRLSRQPACRYSF